MPSKYLRKRQFCPRIMLTRCAHEQAPNPIRTHRRTHPSQIKPLSIKSSSSSLETLAWRRAATGRATWEGGRCASWSAAR
ncbi:hypothetical protein GQ55_5G392400 [Panicum hallii var. hallii]|uniref:Uncharacterized protein n=1 Tax=Panicum hallii var. hallii TaxID=1504633 RepID=A0A2T7DN54_9POAL|nr:hypothetical protein GQ55_5G392400 [Panicum hallii var. hallii]